MADDERDFNDKKKINFWGLPPNFLLDSLGVYSTRLYAAARRRPGTEKMTPDQIVARYTKVLAAVGAAGTIVGLLSLVVIRAQLNEMQSSSVQTDKIIAADLDLARAARDQAAAALTNIELSQRAWATPSRQISWRRSAVSWISSERRTSFATTRESR